jgi:hypothetical protein
MYSILRLDVSAGEEVKRTEIPRSSFQVVKDRYYERPQGLDKGQTAEWRLLTIELGKSAHNAEVLTRKISAVARLQNVH